MVMRSGAVLLLLFVPLAACRSSQPRYIVSTTPMLFVGPRHPGLCVAVDPTDAKGVWWWEPGRSGCSSRSTGPNPFPAWAARVARSAAGALEVSFEIGLMTGGPRVVTLEVAGGEMREIATGLNARTERRATLDVPEGPPPNPPRQ